MFWDASALVPLLVRQPGTENVEQLNASNRVVWWGSVVECASAISRLEREGIFNAEEASDLVAALERLVAGAIEVQPVEAVRRRAVRLLRVHPLRAADAFQLGASLVYCRDNPQGVSFVCLDERLRDAARAQGFVILP